MTFLPSLMYLAFKRPNRRQIKLWLPIFIFWPLLLFGVLVIFFILTIKIGVRASLQTLVNLIKLVCELRGTLISISDIEQQFTIKLM